MTTFFVGFLPVVRRIPIDIYDIFKEDSILSGKQSYITSLVLYIYKFSAFASRFHILFKTQLSESIIELLVHVTNTKTSLQFIDDISCMVDIYISSIINSQPESIY